MEEIKQEFSERIKKHLKRTLLGFTYLNSFMIVLGILNFLLMGIFEDTIKSVTLISVFLIFGYIFISPLFFIAFIIIFIKYRNCEFIFNQGILILCNSAFFIVTTLFTVLIIFIDLGFD